MGCDREGLAAWSDLDLLRVQELAIDPVSQFDRSIAQTPA
jgi:hypothetical protein